MFPIQLAVFDMAGTTVEDNKTVENSFYEAATKSGLQVTRQRINAMQGLPKRIVIESFWGEVIGRDHADFQQKVDETYAAFRQILENQYLTKPVLPTEGALETFAWLREHGVKIALTTGFYRGVTNILLNRLGWDKGLDENFRGSADSIIDLSLTPDETGKGRPHPDMILKAMEILGISDAKQVVNIGDTPSDLQSGRAAGCLLSLGVTNGSHTREQLLIHDNDGLLDSMKEFPNFISEFLSKMSV
ncbi:MAG: HAD hydrolase-like protein [Saprospiraceae bacterium]|nr:HAD hydrolase-like protein [Saprospiraceae bacterium]